LIAALPVPPVAPTVVGDASVNAATRAATRPKMIFFMRYSFWLV
jgi:hypothetical protein